MECVYATHFTKEVTSGQCVKLILGKCLVTSEQFKIAFMHFCHDRILEATIIRTRIKFVG